MQAGGRLTPKFCEMGVGDNAGMGNSAVKYGNI